MMSFNRIENSKINNLFLIEGDIARAAEPFGVTIKRTKIPVHNSLGFTSPDRFRDIEANMLSVLDAFKICASEELDPWNDEDFFRVCMQSLYLSYPKDCLDHFTSADLVEGYNFDRLQIFRNLQFMEYSNYSLLEILSVEWPKLFERSAAITDEMIKYCDETLWAENRTIAFNIPAHYMRELQTSERQMYEIRFKHLSPLFSGPNKPFGILGTCKCRLIPTDPSSNLSFI